MPRRRTAKVELSRGRLLDAAARLFRERGYMSTTMRAIPKEAGIEAGSIYYHYRSKDELIGAVLDFSIKAVFSATSTAVSELPTDATLGERIETAINAHTSAILKKCDYMLAMRTVFGQVPAEVWRRHMRLREGYEKLWHKLLADTRRAGAVRSPTQISRSRGCFFLAA